MSTKESASTRHEFAKNYIEKRYIGAKVPSTQQEVVYVVPDGKILMLYANNDNGWQGLTAANYDELQSLDIITYNDAQTGMTVEFYKYELQQFLENNFLQWKSDRDGERTRTRMLVKRVSFDGANKFVLYSSKSPELWFSPELLTSRNLKAGTCSAEDNQLIKSLFMEKPKKKIRS
jgi:hypothetical protein